MEMKHLLISLSVITIALSGCGKDDKSEEGVVTVEEGNDQGQNSSNDKTSDQNANKGNEKSSNLPSEDELKKMKDSDDNLLKDVKIQENKTFDVPKEEIIEVPGVQLSDFIEVKEEQEYTKYHGGYVFYFDKDEERIEFEQLEEQPSEFKTPKNTKFIRVSIPTLHMDAAILKKK